MNLDFNCGYGDCFWKCFAYQAQVYSLKPPPLLKSCSSSISGIWKKGWKSLEFSAWGGALVFKSGYDAHTRKQVKVVIFFPTVDDTRTLKRVSKTAKFGKKGMFFNPWNCDTCLGIIILTADIEIKINNLDNITWKGYTYSTMHYLFRVAKTDKNSCLGYVFDRWKYLFRVHFVSPCTSIISTFEYECPPKVFWNIT